VKRKPALSTDAQFSIRPPSNSKEKGKKKNFFFFTLASIPRFSAKTDMLIEFQQAHCRPELRSYADFFNRIMPKDNIALVVALR